jgi:2-polyprenyl-3-methyl-5-hydroxy-6-metoxy-1,4-benzoquinol methylase
MMAGTKCHVCGGEKLAPWCPGLLECTTCSHVQADVELSNEELAELYSHKYFHGDEYVDYEAEREALDLNFARRLEQVRNLAPQGGRLFEIGCAYGYFLHQAARAFDVAGCDISSHAVSKAQDAGLNVVCEDYLALPAPDEPYDVICMWDTIEHIGRPRDYVEKARAELAPGGILIASTGDAGSRVARFRREKWRMVHPPTHLHYFTPGSMKTMLMNAGFAAVTVSHEAFYRNVGTSLRKVGELSQSTAVRAITGTLARTPAKNLTLPVNLFDIMTATARVPS